MGRRSRPATLRVGARASVSDRVPCIALAVCLTALAFEPRAEACAEQCRSFALSAPVFDTAHAPVVKTNFGLLRKAGDRWMLTCDGLAGAQWLNTRASAAGLLFVPTPNGLAYSETSGCVWDFAQGDLDGQTVVAASVGETTWAIAADPTSLVQSLQVSTDGGRSFRTALRFPEHVIQDQYHTKFDSIGQSGSRVYVSGASLYPYRPKLSYSDDTGQTWKEREPELGSWERNERYSIVDVSFSSRKRVLATRSHVAELTDSLWSSDDSGATWQPVLSLPNGERLVGVAVSRRNRALYVATQPSSATAKGNLYVSRDEGASFETPIVGDTPYRCLTENRGKLYLCSQDDDGTFGVLQSNDEGRTFDWLVRLDDIMETSECGESAAPGADRVCSDAATVLCSMTNAGICGVEEGQAPSDAASREEKTGVDTSSRGCAVQPVRWNSQPWSLGLAAALVALRLRRSVLPKEPSRQ